MLSQALLHIGQVDTIMERYPLSTHSKELTITGCVFSLSVLGLSYFATLKQERVLPAFRFFRSKVGMQRELSSSGALAGTDASGTSRRLRRWHTIGSQVVTDNGTPIRLNGINWSGFETSNKVPGGLDHQDYKTILESMKKAGFNIVRIPLSNAVVENPLVPTSIAFTLNGLRINQDLQHLNSLEILDRLVTYSGKIGLRVVLDNHRSTSGGGPQENGLWFTNEFPETSWIDDWRTLTKRYRDDDTVIGFDLRNEPHSREGGGACWSCGGERDWHLAAQRAGNVIVSEDPSKLIIIEGVDVYKDDSTWWGGNLEGVRDEPVQLSLPNHVIYSAHEYGPDEHSQPWFNSRTSTTSLQQLWNRRWGFIVEQGIAPVFVGEFGTSLGDQPSEITAGSQAQWFTAFVQYLQRRPRIGWGYWSANAEDRYAFFEADYVKERAESTLLRQLMAHDNECIQSTSIQGLGAKEDTRRKEGYGNGSTAQKLLHDCSMTTDSAALPARDENGGRDAYIAETVIRATQNAIRTLPERSKLK